MRANSLARVNMVRSMGTALADQYLARFHKAFGQPAHAILLFDLGRGVELIYALERATEIEFHFGLATLSMIFGLAGFVVAWAIYSARLLSADRLRQAFGPVHRLLVNKYYMDWLYEDQLVRRVVVRTVATGLDLFDRYVVDGTVNATAWLTRFSASRLRLLQAGQLQLYAAAIFLGIVLIVAGILIVNP